MTRSVPQTRRRPALAPTAALAATLLLAPAAAGAHVGTEPSNHPAGASSLVDFVFSHGCSGEPTTGLTIQIPETVTSVRPTVDAAWDIEVAMVPLDQPVEGGHGTTITERVDTVTFTAHEPIPDGLRAAVTIQLGLPDTPDTTIAFPTIQTCDDTEHAWIELAAEGQDPHDLESPAPTIHLVAADATNEHGHGSEPADDEVDALTVTALVLGGLGVVLGGASLLRRRTA